MRWSRPPPATLPLFPTTKKRNPTIPNPRAISRKISRLIPSNKLFRLLLLIGLLALIPPFFFHLRLRRFQQMQARKCGWIEKPPLVCAHGGDSSKAFPNTMEAFRIALQSHVDCVEVDVSRTSDGFLVALHDRDLQRISGNKTAKVGHMTFNEIQELDAGFESTQDMQKHSVPLVENALELLSESVRQVILDIKVGPPLYEQYLAEDTLSIVKRAQCKNCLIWAKSDTISNNVIKLSQDVMVGYIVMKDPLTGAVSELGRIKGAHVGGVYHPLINEKLLRNFHRRGEKVYAWTVDDTDSMQRMLTEHVDAIVTSDPTQLMHLMQDLRTECLQEGFSLP
ncbi:Glycerophosphodiester phosphodiesterase [Rhynchospora pubera]|uniref:glycerophosphodiester phosphodiesterase n=1 Tax=Rhynchospora pubera TaxID=906938 RepID=A0AAV8HMP3_9POAL|nr:Glycerophosphodiester phosphodiesterase [Rhynchospora pubera]KAJ4819148.1 Glycerophosphodiester phosphodiesterase [Rhynchospora pubera]